MQRRQQRESTILSLKSQSEAGDSLSPRSRSLEDQFDQWLFWLDACISRCQYKKVLKEIKTNKTFLLLPRYPKIKLIICETILKIIKHKIRKYNLKDSDFQVIRNHEKRFQKYRDDFLENVKELSFITLNHRIKLYLKFLYYCAIFYKSMNKYMTSTSYLLLCENLIKDSLPFINQPGIFVIIQRIYLLLAHIMIANRDLDLCLHYVNKSIDIAIREFLFSGVITDKTYVNLTLSHFFRGICFEYSGQIMDTIQNYQHSQWLCEKLVVIDNYLLYNFFSRLIKRAMQFNKLLIRIKNEDIALKLSKLAKDKKSGLKFKMSSIMKQISYGEPPDSAKQKKLIQTLSSLQIPEIEALQGSKSVNDYILSDGRLIQLYFKDEFKDLIKSSNKITLYDCDLKTKHKIHEIVNKINYEKLMKKERSSSRKKRTRNEARKDPNQSLLRSQSNLSSRGDSKKKKRNRVLTSICSYNTKSTNSIQTNFTMSTINKSQSKSQNKSQSRSQSQTLQNLKYSSKGINMKVVKKYSLNGDCFLKSFKKKKMYIDYLNDKELNFQKKLLELKSKENIPYVETDSKTDATLFYNRVLGDIKEENKKVNLKPTYSTKVQRKQAIMNYALKSLDPKSLPVTNTDTEVSFMQRKKKETLKDPNEGMIERINQELHFLNKKYDKDKEKYKHAKYKFLTRSKSSKPKTKTKEFLFEMPKRKEKLEIEKYLVKA